MTAESILKILRECKDSEYCPCKGVTLESTEKAIECKQKFNLEFKYYENDDGKKGWHAEYSRVFD